MPFLVHVIHLLYATLSFSTMNKRELHYYWRHIRKVKTWYLIVALIISIGLSAWALRQNSLKMAQKVEAVIAADEANAGIDNALRDLGNFVTHHMNAALPNNQPIELEKSYERAVQKVYEDAQVTANGSIYKSAQAVCENPNVILAERARCIQEYVTKNTTPGKEPAPIEFPPKEKFSYNFISPTLSFDLAGWSVLSTVVLLFAIISRALAEKIVQKRLKDYQ